MRSSLIQFLNDAWAHMLNALKEVFPDDLELQQAAQETYDDNLGPDDEEEDERRREQRQLLNTLFE
jgi:hypothetical protein